MTEAHLIRLLKAIADPTRLKILRLLKRRGICSLDKDVGLCARDIEAQVHLSQPTVSHHMTVLSRAGLVHAEKIGLWMWYRRNEKAIRNLAETMGSDL